MGGGQSDRQTPSARFCATKKLNLAVKKKKRIKKMTKSSPTFSISTSQVACLQYGILWTAAMALFESHQLVRTGCRLYCCTLHTGHRLQEAGRLKTTYLHL